MRVIITGGTGFLGSALTAGLVAAGHEVIILSRNPEKASGLPDGVPVVRWDAKTSYGWYTYADGADAIINIAGASIAGENLFPTRWSSERRRLLYESRINAGHAIVAGLQQVKTPPKVLIQMSAVGYYGPSGSEELTEDAPASGDFLSSITQAWEDGTKPVEALGVRQVIIRTGIVLDSDAQILKLMALPVRLFVGGPLGSGKQYISWIHRDDFVQAVLFLLEKADAAGAYNMTAPNPEMNQDFMKTIGEILHRPTFFPTPAFAFRLAFGELATTIVDGQRVLPARLQEAGYEFQYPELKPALEDCLS